MNCSRCNNPIRDNSYSLQFSSILKYVDMPNEPSVWESLGKIEDLCYSCFTFLKNKLKTFKKDNWL